MSWVVSEFSSEQAFGRVRDPDSGREAVFAIEVWMPCDPETARDLDDSDERRHLLLPRVGEPVDITWKKGYRGVDVPSRVVRTLTITDVLPRRTFREWLNAMAAYIPTLAGLTASAWEELAISVEVDETTESSTPADPVEHLGLLAYIQHHASSPAFHDALAWISDEGTSHAIALEGGGDHPVVHVSLPAETIDGLVGDKLVLRVSRPGLERGR